MTTILMLNQTPIIAHTGSHPSATWRSDLKLPRKEAGLTSEGGPRNTTLRPVKPG